MHGDEGFATFQKLTDDNFKKYANLYNWTIIDNNEDINTAVNIIAELINQLVLSGDGVSNEN